MTDRLSSSSQTDAAPQSVPVGAPFAERHFLACAAVLLLAMGVAMFAGVFLDSDTMDEAFHLRFGYTFLRTGQLPAVLEHPPLAQALSALDRKSTRLNSSHLGISYAVFCLKKK